MSTTTAPTTPTTRDEPRRVRIRRAGALAVTRRYVLVDADTDQSIGAGYGSHDEAARAANRHGWAVIA